MSKTPTRPDGSRLGVVGPLSGTLKFVGTWYGVCGPFPGAENIPKNAAEVMGERPRPLTYAEAERMAAAVRASYPNLADLEVRCLVKLSK